jgi:predicted nucleic acid-binding protein
MKGWIVDKSVAARFDVGGVSDQLLGADGPLFLCEVGLLEQLYSARSGNDYDRLAKSLRANFDILSSPPDLLSRALVLQHQLARHRGLWHRRPIPDLLISVTAMHHDVGVAHLDNDFELIAEVVSLRTWKLEVD